MLQKVKSFLFAKKQQTKLKQQSKRLKRKTDLCKVCFKKIEENSFTSIILKNRTICHECFLEMGSVFQKFKINNIKCMFLYHYNEKVQGLLYQFKGCKDYELRTIFLENFKHYLRIKFRDYVLIPAPSSKKGDEERGFNHVQEMFSVLNLKMINCIQKTENIKQADLTQKERENVGKYLKIDEINLFNKKVLLVDDVFTTGSTIKSMIELVKSKHPKKIKCLLMCKTIDLDKR